MITSFKAHQIMIIITKVFFF